MKARVPKEYDNLNPRQKERLKAYCVEVALNAAREQEERDCRIILDLYMKMVCCTLHDAFGFGEKRLNYFIGNHRRLFARQNKLVEKGSQLEYLNRRMSEIFKKDGFPQDFVDSILGKVEIVDGRPEN